MNGWAFASKLCNPATTSDGRLLASNHPFPYGDEPAHRVVEYVDDGELDDRIERYGDKEIRDDITVDTAGNVYITDMTNNTIGVTRPSGEYEVLARDDERLLWPDGFCCGPDGNIYVTVTQLHRAPPFNKGKRGVVHAA